MPHHLLKLEHDQRALVPATKIGEFGQSLWNLPISIRRKVRMCVTASWSITKGFHTPEKVIERYFEEYNGVESLIKTTYSETAVTIWIQGTPGAYQKTTVHIVDSGTNTAIAFARLAGDALSVGAIANESAILEALSNVQTLCGYVPRVTQNFVIGNTRGHLLTAGPNRKGPGEFGDKHISFLARLRRDDAQSISIVESNYYTQTAYEVQQLDASGFSTEALDVIRALLQSVVAEPTLQQIEPVVAHRDFTPWNTCLRPDGQLFVFDWENGRDDWLPLVDMFHFYVITAFLGRGSKGTCWSQFRREWIKYANALGVPAGQVRPLYRAYLLDVTLYYLMARHRAPNVGSDNLLHKLEAECRAEYNAANC